MPKYQMWQNTQNIPNILPGCWNYQNKNLASAYLAKPQRPAGIHIKQTQPNMELYYELN